MSVDSVYHQVWLEEMERRLTEQHRRIYLEGAMEWIADSLTTLLEEPVLAELPALCPALRTLGELRDYARGAKDRARDFARPAGASA